MLPLEGVRVLDASRVLAGPYAAMMLADLGADVVKVERPGKGDPTRAWGPPFQGGESAYYLSINRNKRGVTLNLEAEEAREIFRKLARRSRVVIENFRPADVAAWKLDAPDAVWCSIRGYASDDRPAYDLALQAETGWMSITGEEGRPPVRIGVAVIDLLTAHYAVQSILAALRMGGGRRLEISMFDCATASLAYMGQYFLATGETPPRMGSGHPTIAPYQAFEASDGFFVAAVGSPEIWERFCRAVDPELGRDERFADNASRVRHRAALQERLQALFRTKRAAEWLEILRTNDVPSAPVNDLRAALDQAHLQKIGDLTLVGPPPVFDSAVRRPPPRLGEHTDEVLGELGLSPAEISRLRTANAI